MFDTHVHSAASPDSEMSPEVAIAAAAAKGLGITFTEHVDYSDENAKRDPNATDAIRGVGDFVCDFTTYPAGYRKFRGAEVSLGLEFGLTHAFLAENKKLAAGDYDFILGSIHSVDGVEIYQACAGNLPNEPYAQAILSDDTDAVRGCIRRYLQYSAEMVQLSDFFDSFGHIDYIARYLPLASENFFYENFADEFDILLRMIAEREIALEINTKFLVSGGQFPARTSGEVMQKICRRFRELGGRLCTIGSDAHREGNVGHGISAGHELAAAAGLATVHFRERKPVHCG